jgi:predicted acylesterase/phospholipase RssA
MAGKRALVISGGGSRGSFGVGAASWLMEALGMEFDIFAGTSTGALIAPMLAAQGKAALPELRRQYTTVKTGDIIKPRIFNPLKLSLTSWYYSDPLKKRVDAGMTDALYQQLVSSGRQLVLTTVDLQTGKIVYFQTGPSVPLDPNDAGEAAIVPITSRKQLVDAMVASSSIPFFMPPQKLSVDGKTDPIVDGGVREYAPIEIAIQAGAEEIWCLVLMPEPRVVTGKPKPYDNVVDITQRTVDLLSREVGESDIKLSSLYTEAILYVDELRRRLVQKLPSAATDIDEVFRTTPDNPFADKKPVRLHVIRPQKELEGDTLRFDPGEMKTNLKYGCSVARQMFPRDDLPADWCDRLVK